MTIRVLIVEDNRDIRALFEAGLVMRGYVVETAADGEAALARLAEMMLPPSVIVADLHMPVMDGWDLLTALAADPRWSSIPVIVLTAADDATRSAPRPPTILIKPVALADLAAAINAAVGA